MITIVLAGVWRWVFPDLAKIDEIEELRPEPTMAAGSRPVTFKPMSTIRIPPILRPEAGGNREVDATGATVREALENLVATYPALRDRIFDGTSCRSS